MRSIPVIDVTALRTGSGAVAVAAEITGKVSRESPEPFAAQLGARASDHG